MGFFLDSKNNEYNKPQGYIPKRVGRRSKGSVASYLGVTFGKFFDVTLAPVTRLIGITSGVSIYGVKCWISWMNLSQEEREKVQKEVIKNQIPGAPLGETFIDYTDIIENGPEDQPIIIDKRRPPMVWERMIAGNVEDPPEFTVYATSTEYASEKTEIAFHGRHTFMSLTYSRINPLSGKMERYRTKFGYNSKGGTNSFIFNVGKISGIENAGELRDAYSALYDFSRTYTITNKQVNQAFASAQRHVYDGYNIFSNNCVTFIMEVAKDIGLDISDSVKSEVLSTGGAYAVNWWIKGFGEFIRFINSDYMIKRLGRYDITYQGFGQMQFTLEDIKRNFTTGLGLGNASGCSPFKVTDTIRASFYEHNMADENDLTSSRIFYLKEQNRVGSNFFKEIKNFKTRLSEKKTIPEESYGPALSKFKREFSAIISQENLPENRAEDITKRILRLKKLDGDIQRWFARSLGASDEFWRDIQALSSCIDSEIDIKNREYARTCEYITQGGDLFILINSTVAGRFNGKIGEGGGPVCMPVPKAFIAAGIRIFGNRQAVCDAYIIKHDKSGRIHDEEKEKLKGRLGRLIKVVYDFMAAQMEYITMQVISDTDLNYAFSELEWAERQDGYGSSIGAEYLWSLILCRYLDGANVYIEGDISNVSTLCDHLILGLDRALSGEDNNLLRGIKIYLNSVPENEATERILDMIVDSYISPIFIYKAASFKGKKAKEGLWELRNELMKSQALLDKIEALTK